MPYDDPDPSDPNLLVGVAVTGDSESDREMAYTFGEELAGLWYAEEFILRLFGSPRYPGLHRLLTILGEDEIQRIIGECCGIWRRARVVVRDTPIECGSSPLLDSEER